MTDTTYSVTADELRQFIERIERLEACVQSAIWHWQNRREIPCKAYWLDMPMSAEWVERDLPPVA